MSTPVRTGSYTEIRSNSGSLSQSITVPSDATVALIWVMGGYFTGSSPSVTIGGQSATLLTRVQDSGETYNACFVLENPPTGSQTYAISGFGTLSALEGTFHIIGYYKNSVGVRSYSQATDGSGSNTTITTGAMTSVSGDLAVVGAASYDGTACDTAINSQTEVYNSSTAYLGTYAAAAEKSLSGTSATMSSYGRYPNCTAVVLEQLVDTTLNQYSFRFFNDDGSESGSTTKAALNTNINLSVNDVARIRFLIDATGDPSGKQFQLEYRKKPSGGSFGSWTKVN